MPSAYGSQGVASQYSLASLAGLKVLEEGGNAFDAAIAMSAVLTVALPHTGDLGGDAFLLAMTPGGEVLAYNGSGRSPRTFDPERFLAERPLRGPLTLTIPGLVDTWHHMVENHTRLPLGKLLSKAISLASNGLPTPEPLARAVEALRSQLSSFPGWKRTYDHLYPGATYRPKDKARVLEIIARKGPRAFYEDESGVTSSIVEELGRQGADVGVEDFQGHRGEAVRPLRTSVDSIEAELYELPPNSQGHTGLQIIKTVDHHLGTISPHRDLRLYLRAVGLSYEYRDHNLGDPSYMQKTLEDLEKDLVHENLEGEGSPPATVGGDTTFLTAVDRWGNLVGFIQSLYHPFGSGLVARDIAFQNRGHGFSFEKGLPNSPAPGKRPLHTLSILGVVRSDRRLMIGCAGGDLRPQIHAVVLSNIAESGWILSRGLHRPRILLATEVKRLSAKIVLEQPLEAHVPPGYSVEKIVPSAATGIVQASQLTSGELVETAADPRSTGVALAL